MNLYQTLSIWTQTVEGSLTVWEVASVALLFVHWVVSHFSDAKNFTP